MDITLGLDFGTHQSKLCMSYMPNNELICEFVEFELADGNKSVFLPSVIQINKDNSIRIGSFDKECCATRSFAPPEEPTLPARPSVSLPKEPSLAFPPKPTRTGSTPVIDDKTDWLGALKSIGAALKPVDENTYNKALRAWNDECQKIKDAHVVWEKEFETVRQTLNAWQQRVDAINAEYNARYSKWEHHKMEYRVFRNFKQATYTDSMPWENEISAETLTIWYLTYLLLYSRGVVKQKFDERFEESVSVQMGVPAGLNDGASRKIHYKGLRLLVAARHLMDRFNGPEEFCATSYMTLLELTNDAGGDVTKEADEFGFVVKPEAYAGLQSLTYSERLSRGNMHILVDIGGGTTDIAFFTIDKEKMPAIHTVMSFHKGLNFVLELYIARHPECSMGEAQDLLRKDPDMFTGAISEYTKQLKERLNQIIELVTSEFNVVMADKCISVYQLNDAMVGRPIVYCGGGSVFEKMRVKQHFFHDMRIINKETLNIPNLVNRDIPDVYYTILATAYGLSIPTVDEISIIDASQLWKVVADNAVQDKPVLTELKEHGMLDD